MLVRFVRSHCSPGPLWLKTADPSAHASAHGKRFMFAAAHWLNVDYYPTIVDLNYT